MAVNTSAPQDAPVPSSVPLMMATYLEESAADPIPSPVAATSGSVLTILTQTGRVCSALLAVVVVFAIVINAMTVYAQEKDRRTCGVDWLLWASGSNKTFESILGDKLEEARRDFDRQWADSQPAIKPFDIKEFDPNSLIFTPPVMNNPPTRGRK